MDIDISIVLKGSDMANTSLDMQASLKPKGGINLFTKSQGKSSVESQPGQSTSFISVLDEKTTEAIHDEEKMEKINEDPDHEVLDHIPPGLAHPLWKDAPLSGAEKTTGYLTQDMQQTTMPVSKKMTDQSNQAHPEDPVAGKVNFTFTGVSEVIQSQTVIVPQSGEEVSITGVLGKNPLPSSDKAKSSVLSIQTEKTSENHMKNQLKEVLPKTADIAGQAGQTWENSAGFKMASASRSDENSNLDMDQSATTTTLGLPGVKTRNNANSDKPLTTDNIGTTVDSHLTKMDSSSGNHVMNHIRSEKSGHKTETGSMDQVSEGLRQKDDKSAVDSIFSDLRRTTVSPRDNRTDTTVQKEAGYIASITQKPIAAVNDRVPAIGPPLSEGLSQVELTDTAVFMKSSAAGTTAADQNDQQSWNTASDRHHRGNYPG